MKEKLFVLVLISKKRGFKAIVGIVLVVILQGILMLAFNVHPVAADDWPMFHHDQYNRGYSTSAAPNTNNIIWEYAPGSYIYSSPAVALGNVYVGSSDQKIYCLDAVGNGDGTTNVIWDYLTGSVILSSPAVDSGSVYVGSQDQKIYCLDSDPSDGVDEGYDDPDGVDYDLIWEYTTGGPVQSSPAVALGNVYVGSSDQKIYCLDADPSDGVDEGYDDPDGVDYDLIWEYTAGYGLESSPAVALGNVYVGTTGNRVYCFDADPSDGVDEGYDDPDGVDYDLIWEYTTGGPVQSSPAVAGGRVFVGSNDDKVYCLDAAGNGDGTTNLIWDYTTGNDVYSSPAVADGKVFVGSHDGKIYAFGLDSDNDGLTDNVDNCPNHPNGPLRGICTEIIAGNYIVSNGQYCTDDNDCDEGEYCEKEQADHYPPGGNGIGDACDCEGNFDCSEGVDAGDVGPFLDDWNQRTIYSNPCTNEDPCTGDFNCSRGVDAGDVGKFLEDWNKRTIYSNPCPACTGEPWCNYPE